MNTNAAINTTFKIEEFTSDDQDDSNKDSDDFTELNLQINQNTTFLNCQIDQKLNDRFNQNLNYQLSQQFKQSTIQYTPHEFNEQLNHRLNHLINQAKPNQYKKSANQSKLDQSKLFSFFFYLFNYYESSLINLNLKLSNLVNYFVFWLNFFVTDVFHCFIFKYLLTTNYQRKVLARWLNKVTNYSLFRNEPDMNFVKLFSNGKLICGLINYLHPGSCSRYDLLDVDDVSVNLEIACRLISTYYALNEKIKLDNLDQKESEQLLINLIAKIRYHEIKSNICSKFSIECEHRNWEMEKKLVHDNYLIRGAGLFVGVCYRLAAFNIYYFRFLDVIIEIVGPDSYCCKRVIIENFESVKQPKNYFNDLQINNEMRQDKNSQSKQIVEIPLKFEIKKQYIQVLYMPLKSGSHKISIVNQGCNIKNSPYNVKIDENNTN